MSEPNAATHFTSELELLLSIVPPRIRQELDALEQSLDDLVEIVLDLGRQPEARFAARFVYFGDAVSAEEIAQVVAAVSAFGEDNRAGIERTLHRISALRNRQGEIVGLTLRVGRALYGTMEMIRDLVESGASIMLLGRPGVGKTTLLREAARVAADQLQKRVVVVDTSNEIAGDGDIPHPAIGHARRMQVAQVAAQHKVMIEAVENHMPEVVVIDEIGTAEEAMAARTIAERGVQLIATAHGISLQNLIQNPTLTDLIGGIQAVTLGDDEARRRGSQKTVLERKAAPTFSMLVELQDRETMVIHSDVAASVDLMLRHQEPRPEVRVRTADGGWESRGVLLSPAALEQQAAPAHNMIAQAQQAGDRALKLYSFGVSRNLLERIIYRLFLPIKLTRDIDDADVIFVIKSAESSEQLVHAIEKGIPIFTVKINAISQIETAFKKLQKQLPELRNSATDGFLHPLEEAELAVEQAMTSQKPITLRPQDPFVRRMQHELVEQYGLRSSSSGVEPMRYVVVYP